MALNSLYQVHLHIMENEKTISYYCFNRRCHGSIYFSSTIQIADLPLSLATLSTDHYCSLCNSRLVSIMDIELKLAVYPYKKSVAHSAYLDNYIYSIK
jgi:hypothetical protein